MMSIKTADILGEVMVERERQTTLFGEQNWDTGAAARYEPNAIAAKRRCDENTELGTVTWLDIAYEEFWEAFSETDPVKRREELIQLAAVVVAAIEAEDRRAEADIDDVADAFANGDWRGK